MDNEELSKLYTWRFCGETTARTFTGAIDALKRDMFGANAKKCGEALLIAVDNFYRQTTGLPLPQGGMSEGK